jgi:hypothetical protein
MQEKDKLQLPKVSMEVVGRTSRSSVQSAKSPRALGGEKQASLPSSASIGKNSKKSVQMLSDGKQAEQHVRGSYFDIKQTSVRLDDEDDWADEDDGLVGEAKALGTIHPHLYQGSYMPKKSAGQMSRMSKNSAASSNQGDRLDEIFVQPFVRANARIQESSLGRNIDRMLHKVSTKVFFWSFQSLANIAVILIIFYWASGKLLSWLV